MGDSFFTRALMRGIFPAEVSGDSNAGEGNPPLPDDDFNSPFSLALMKGMLPSEASEFSDAREGGPSPKPEEIVWG